ncbi:hypothetical protein D3C78_1816950 [compost metagenome]
MLTVCQLENFFGATHGQARKYPHQYCAGSRGYSLANSQLALESGAPQVRLKDMALVACMGIKQPCWGWRFLQVQMA